jgi:ribosomal protein S18 acetylase RimI-like enzyme
VLLEACRRLQSKGAQVARVQCAAHNIAFYESAGFHVANRWQWFVRE